MTVLHTRTLVQETAAGPADTNPHFTSSASQTSNPQYLHQLGPNPVAHVRVWKQVNSVWQFLGLFALNISGAGTPIGGNNAPLRFQVIDGPASLSVTDTPNNPLS